jgi:hypothetical protein
VIVPPTLTVEGEAEIEELDDSKAAATVVTLSDPLPALYPVAVAESVKAAAALAEEGAVTVQEKTTSDVPTVCTTGLVDAMVYAGVPDGMVRVAETEVDPVSNLIEAEIVNDSLVETVPPVEPDGAEIAKLSILMFGVTVIAVEVIVPVVTALPEY